MVFQEEPSHLEACSHPQPVAVLLTLLAGAGKALLLFCKHVCLLWESFGFIISAITNSGAAAIVLGELQRSCRAPVPSPSAAGAVQIQATQVGLVLPKTPESHGSAAS